MPRSPGGPGHAASGQARPWACPAPGLAKPFMGLKIAVAGKGGSGKTTVSVLLAKILAEDGQKVLLVDLDSDPNLANALGIPSGGAPPLVERRDLIAERTGSPRTPGGTLLLNPPRAA